MKLSETQYQILYEAMQDEDGHFYLNNCVYPRSLSGLIRLGAVVRGDNERLNVTQAGVEAVLSEIVRRAFMSATDQGLGRQQAAEEGSAAGDG